jgi:hypothetical protein
MSPKKRPKVLKMPPPRKLKRVPTKDNDAPLPDITIRLYRSEHPQVFARLLKTTPRARATVLRYFAERGMEIDTYVSASMRAMFDAAVVLKPIVADATGGVALNATPAVPVAPEQHPSPLASKHEVVDALGDITGLF